MYLIRRIDPVSTYITREGIYVGSFDNSDTEPLLVPPYDTATLNDFYTLCYIGDVSAFVDSLSQDTMLSFVWQQPVNAHISKQFKLQSYLALYNVTAGEYVYEGVPVNDEPTWRSALQAQIQIADGRVYFGVGHELVCHDLATGRKLWGQDQRGDLIFAGFAVDGDRVVVLSESQVLKCYDAASGQQLWSRLAAGTSTQIAGRVLNGVVYFAGGSDGILYAVDLDDGSDLWKLRGEDYGDYDRWLFDVNVIPGEGDSPGRVVVGNDGVAYCFEAVR